MRDSVIRETANLIEEKKLRRRRGRLVTSLAALVAAGTFGVLMLTGVAMTRKDKVLDCPYEGQLLAHVHNDDCYNADGILVCPLPELELHTHDASCYQTETYLICGQEETPGHQHDESCYTWVRGDLICTDESEEHEHTDDCYDWYQELSCGMAEGEGAHWHTDACYETVSTLICDKPEITETHTHGAECFQIVETVVDEPVQVSPEFVLPEETAEPEVSEPQGDPYADVEDWTYWDAMFAGLELTGKWDDDLLTVASSQAGYTESQRNYVVSASGEHKGYTRYGAWYGVPYGDWCAMYVSFCLNYAGIPDTALPWDSNVPNWAQVLNSLQMYVPAEDPDFAPRPGDIVFIDYDRTRAPYTDEEGRVIQPVTGPGDADHVGIAYYMDVERNELVVLEGNSSDRVQYVTYDLNDYYILGVGVLPENPNYVPPMEETAAEEAPLEVSEESRELTEAAEEPAVFFSDAEEETEDDNDTENENGTPADEAGAEASDEMTADGEASEEPASDEMASDELASDEMASDELASDELASQEPVITFEEKVNGLTVSVEAPVGAFPEGTTMTVTPVAAEDVEQAVTEAVETQVLSIQAVDITFFDADGNKIEPAMPIRVTMTLDEAMEADTAPVVVHVDDEGAAAVVEQTAAEELTEAPADNAVVFDSDSFSVYAIVYTVDFHWEVNGKMYEFSIPGGGFVSFYKLVEVLGIVGDTNKGNSDAENAEITDAESADGEQADAALTLNDVEVSEATREFVADVEKVEFSSPNLVWVGKVDESTTVGELKDANGLEVQYSDELTEEQIAEINNTVVESGDWALISMLPFASEETLTVTMKTGEVFTIRVTDAQIKKTVISASGETYEITVTYDDSAEIPDGAELKVKEILPEDEKYDEYYQQSLEKVGVVDTEAEEEAETIVDAVTDALGGLKVLISSDDTDEKEEGAKQTSEYARIFDIQIWADGQEIQPKSAVTVNIKLLDAPEDSKAVPSVVHFAKEGAELMELAEKAENSEDNGLQFVTDEFSVYSVVYTVDFLFNINGKEYSFSLEGGDSTSFKEIIEKFEILDKENVEPFINNIAKVEFSNPDYLWNGKLEEDAFAGDLKEKYNLDIQYASSIRQGNILAMNVHHYSAPDWVLIALKPFISEETLTVTMKNGEVFTVKVTDAQTDAVHNSDGTVQTITNPAGTTIDLFNYYVSADTKTTAGRDQWPGHIHNDSDQFQFNWYDLDGTYAASWSEGWNDHDDNWRNSHLLGYGNNLGINEGHAFKFSPAMAGTVIDGTTGLKTSDGATRVNSWTTDGDPQQGIVQGTLSGGYPILTNDSSLGTDGESLAYLFNYDSVNGKDVYSGVDQLLYVDPEGYYTYDSRDFKANYNTDGTFTVSDQTSSDTEVRGFWPFGQQVFWVGMHMNTQFSIPTNGQVLNPQGVYKDMQFEFSGDDDTWLYIDGVLVGDGGGIHNRTEIDINFASGTVTVTGKKDAVHTGTFEETKYLDDIFKDAGKYNDSEWEDIGDGSGHKRMKAGTYHTFDMFYLERGGGESNLYIHYNLVSTADFTGHKSYFGSDDDDILRRDQFQFELVGLDGKYRSVWSDEAQDYVLIPASEEGASSAKAIMPNNADTSGAGTVASPYFNNNTTTPLSDESTVGSQTYITGVTEDGNINFGSAVISELDMNEADHGNAPVYRYIIREIVPDDAKNEAGVTWANATDEQKAAGGFVKENVTYDGTIYYMTGRVTSWQETDATGQTVTRHGLSKTYYTDDTFTEKADDVTFVSFENRYVRTYGNVDFTKVNGSGQVLSGAEFTLYKDRACTKVAKDLDDEDAVVTSGTDGKVSFTNIPVGTYYMKETVAPTDYSLDTTLYKVTITDSRDTTVSSKIIIDGDETETTVTQIINTKPGEISVIKKWVDQNGKEVPGGSREATVQLRRYHYVSSGGSTPSSKTVTVTLDFPGAGADWNPASTYEFSGTIIGTSATISWNPGGSTFYYDSAKINPISKNGDGTYTVTADFSSSDNITYYCSETWASGSSISNCSINGGSAPPVTYSLEKDTSFPSTTDTEATQILSSSNNWAHSWSIGGTESSHSGYDFPAKDDNNKDYLYYIIELKGDTEVPIGGELSDGVTLQSITYSPALTAESPGLQEGLVTVTNKVTEPETVDIVIKKFKKDDLGNTSAETLKGATFRLEKYTSSFYQGKDDNWTAQTVADTNETGIFNFTGLQEGYYKIVEVETPAGYVKLSTDPTFEVRNVSGQLEVIFTDTNLVTYTEENGFRFGNEPGVALPNTGGPGRRFFTILGSILILGASLLLWRRRRLI